ncbi:hypothetical protein A2886_00105 [candidate division WWE3 bacterium RIFCSPHIGHO2_01_FULL_42_13]|uniref:Bacterial bifunctional deaminase-reductase C-terminal domain-containing protein n=1 Tax=candidate division WWE3 bacterium RIFCSPHIGHO2_01_FULL_42_13 TaxID=1802617 RepID=A0A1F4USZ7_UNCKA|nr:MAG: hypothetical protein A2886_00105 [candidate division WWE3 bacterium RIFCSPHIGHO2_01_FULL_42_13]
MKVVLLMVITPNGMICRENGEEDFISDRSWKEYVRILNEARNVIWGRKAYENFMGWENAGEKLKDLEGVKKYVLSSNPNLAPSGGFQLVTSVEEYLSEVENEGFDTVMVTGGGKLNSEFMKRGLVDEIILNVEPFILGKGISVFSEEEFEFNLKLQGVREIGSGTLQLKYSINPRS